jgi:ATP-dependent helicase/nuclease subunit A
MSLRVPNPEQLKAISHTGGVLLKAGAGSGKTFVLVEHLIYLSTKWISEFKKNQFSDFEEFIRGKYSKVVLMTFTKKAAGEMSIRLFERFEQQKHIATGDEIYWSICNEALLALNVTTIDGFCKKLISNGYFKNVPSKAEVIFLRERSLQVQEVFDRWLSLNRLTIKKNIFEIISRRRNELLHSFALIFNDPSLRLKWRLISLDELHPDHVDKIISKSFELNNIGEEIESIRRLEIPELKECSAFEKNVRNFQETTLPDVDSMKKLELYFSLFSQIKTLQPERTVAKKDVYHDRAYEGLVNLRSWIRCWRDIIIEYKENFDEKIVPWIHLCKEFFEFVDRSLDATRGLTFGDIEYIVYQGLQDKEVQDKVAKDYNYFIVDEFQDTSEVQFQIIRSLIQDNFNKLFCVGDAKQAIYGFRGGELAVFHHCSQLITQEMSLVSNYRSENEVIKFNNSLFSCVLPLGREFKGLDPFSVIPEDQEFPFKSLELKLERVQKIKYKLVNYDKDKFEISTNIINKLEARAIIACIQDQVLQSSSGSIAILYQRLAPSFELIQKMILLQIGFTAQFKVDIKNDPILFLIIILCKRKFDRNSLRTDYFLLIAKSIFFHLSIDLVISEQHLDQFEKNEKFFGLKAAIRMFLSSLNISVENTDLNLLVIDKLVDLFEADLEKMLVSFEGEEQEKISLDLRYGSNSSRIQIMTAHASKGLEFETVFLGGVHTNGKDSLDYSLFGKLPGSFVWYKDISQRLKKITPHFQFEKELNKYKDFSESKRLFYVACTRAKNKLVWVDFIDLDFNSPKNSWIEGLRAWESQEKVETFLSVYELEDEVQVADFEKFSFKLPLYFFDPQGIYTKPQSVSSLCVLSDLSVTRLIALLECPRKHYFKNILKIDDSEIKKKSVFGFNLDDEIFDDQDDLINQLTFRSSTERGSQVHLNISQMISKQGVIPRDVINTDLIESFNLLKDLLSPFWKYNLMSEQGLKFRLFNFMISGIPDLVIESQTENWVKIWDFKTGCPTLESEEKYWFQLMIYAYAAFLTKPWLENKKIELSLVYMDMKEMKTRFVEQTDVVSYLYPIWKKINSPWEVNLESCSQCIYSDICQK